MNLSASGILKKLLEQKDYPAVSIYIPTYIDGTDTRENPIRLKNMLQKCQKQLEEHYSPQFTREFLEKGYALVRDTLYWEHQREGFAMFLSQRFSEHYSLPISPPKSLHLGRYFYILPLLPILNLERTYYILRLSQHTVSLYEAGLETMREMPLLYAPKSIDTILQYDVVEKHIQIHSTPAGKSPGTAAVFHGQGSISDESKHKKNIERFLKEVAKGIEKQLVTESAPMVLAGVDYLQAIYRKENTYPHLIEKGIYEDWTNPDLGRMHQEAGTFVRPYFQQEIDKYIRGYINLDGTVRASSDMESIPKAAMEGRVDVLLVDAEAQVFGRMDAASGQVRLHEQPQPDDEDLMNLTVLQALQKDAKVFAVSRDRMPTPNPIAAIYRY